MIPRYTRPAMGRIWSDEYKYRQWLEVELAASEALAELGEVPREAAAALRQHADFDLERIGAIENEVKHDVIAFTTAVAEKLAAAGAADASRWLHYGLTSNDVVDTAQALQLKASSAILQTGLEALQAVLKKRALEFQHTHPFAFDHVRYVTAGEDLPEAQGFVEQYAGQRAAPAHIIRLLVKGVESFTLPCHRSATRHGDGCAQPVDGSSIRHAVLTRSRWDQALRTRYAWMRQRGYIDVCRAAL